MANTLSYAPLRNRYHITYCDKKYAFNIPPPPAKLLHFRRIKRGLYYHNCDPGIGVVTLLQKVEGNVDSFTERQIEEARQYRAACSMVGSVVDIPLPIRPFTGGQKAY